MTFELGVKVNVGLGQVWEVGAGRAFGKENRVTSCKGT